MDIGFHVKGGALLLALLFSVNASADTVRAYNVGPLTLQVVRNYSNVEAHPTTSVFSPFQYKVLSGGANVNWSGNGNLLTGMFPQSSTNWVASSKDHEVSSPASLEAYSIVARKQTGEISSSDYIIVQQTSSYAAHPSAVASLPSGYTLVGGGAKVNWSGAGNLLYASYPNGNSWVASSKDHDISSPATITSYAIGLSNAFLQANRLAVQSRQVTSGTTNHPNATCTLDYGYKIIGGGAKANWQGNGSLLTSSFPSDEQAWYGAAKDHMRADPSSITVYCIGLRAY
jgi:vibriolysin